MRSYPLQVLHWRLISFTVTYINDKYERVSSEGAYLTSDVLARPNLKVAINSTVTRIIWQEVGGQHRAAGVEFARTMDGPRYLALAKRDVVISYVFFASLPSSCC